LHKNSFLANPLKLIISIVTVIISLILAGTLFYIWRPGPALLFLLIAVIFLIESFFCGAIVSVSNEGIKQIMTGKCIKEFRWAEIQEIGVIGSNLFTKTAKDEHGTLYIYISKKMMNQQDRFDMILKWPPNDKIYLQYTKQRICSIQMQWNSKIDTYNTGNLIL
jgi:hypothetical protein